MKLRNNKAKNGILCLSFHVSPTVDIWSCCCHCIRHCWFRYRRWWNSCVFISFNSYKINYNVAMAFQSEWLWCDVMWCDGMWCDVCMWIPIEAFLLYEYIWTEYRHISRIAFSKCLFRLKCIRLRDGFFSIIFPCVSSELFTFIVQYAEC